MDIGMLWHDDDPKRTLAEKVGRAVAFYQAKYGTRPTVCFVKPAWLSAEPAEYLSGVRMRGGRSVIKNHLWLGVEEQKAAA